MAELNYQVNTDPKEQEQSFDPLPAGEYVVVVTDSDYLDNKKGTGRMLRLVYQVIEGPFKERKLFENLNLEHENQQAATIARKALNSIGMAVGVIDLKDSAQLHNIPLRLDVGIKPSEEYGPQNRIKKHLPYKDDAPAVAPTPQKEEKKATPAQNGKKHPWEK